MNIEKMNAAQLKELRQQIDNAIAAKRREELVAFRKEVEKMAAERGFSITELLSVKTQKAPVIQTYAHPEEPSLTWGGKGMKPKWLKVYLEKGGSLDDCRRPNA